MHCSYCEVELIQNLSIADVLWLRYPISQLCSTCKALFERIPKEHCPTCQKSGQLTSCTECQAWRQDYPHYAFMHHALYQYNTGFKEWLGRYKFQGEYALADVLASEIKQALRPFRNWIICPIPLSKARLATRGFNQVDYLLERSGIDYQSLLEKPLDPAPQSKKTRLERLSLEQPFTLAVEEETITGRSILLVDDVYTTGRTLFHAADCFLSLPVQKIQTFSFAR